MGRDDRESDRRCKADGFGETRIGVAVDARALRPRLRLDVNDDGPARQMARVVSAAFLLQTVSDAAGCSSCSCIGPIGMTVEIACL